MEAYSETDSHFSENDSVSISSAEPDELQDLERLPGNIFVESEKKATNFLDFIKMNCLRCI